jgi:hypothetical protein
LRAVTHCGSSSRQQQQRRARALSRSGSSVCALATEQAAGRLVLSTAAAMGDVESWGRSSKASKGAAAAAAAASGGAPLAATMMRSSTTTGASGGGSSFDDMLPAYRSTRLIMTSLLCFIQGGFNPCMTASLVLEKDVNDLSTLALKPTGPGIASLEDLIWARRKWADWTLKFGLLFMVFSTVYYKYAMSDEQQASNNVEVVALIAFLAVGGLGLWAFCGKSKDGAMTSPLFRGTGSE